MGFFPMSFLTNDTPIRHRKIYLAVCGLGLFFTGILYAWSIMKVPLIREFGFDASTLAMVFTLSMWFFCIGSMGAGFLSKRYPTKYLLLASGALMGAGICLITLINSHSLWLLYLSYGVFFGAGVGISYNTLLSVGNSWFPDRKGFSSGVLQLCFGASTMLLGQLMAMLIHMPEVGWRATFLFFGITTWLVLTGCAMILRKPAPDTVFPAPRKAKRYPIKPQAEISTKEAMHNRDYWLFYLYGTLTAAVGSVVINFSNELAVTMGASMVFATTLVGFLALYNGAGRIFCGLFFDRFGCRKTMFITSFMAITAACLIIAALQLHNLPMGVVGICLSGISFGCCPTISSAFISSKYGLKNFPLNYSIGNTKMMFSSSFITVAGMLLYQTGSYSASFIMLALLATVSFGLIFVIRMPD